MNTITVLYFAALRDLTGQPEETLSLSPELRTVGEILLVLAQRHPGLRLDGVRVALNEEFTDAQAPVTAGDVLALIPPVSGG